MEISRGDIIFADLSPVVGSEQGGVRPVLVIQNDVGNKFSPTVIIAAITSRISKAQLPIHVEVTRDDHGLDRDSVVLCEQIRTIDKRRLREKIAHLEGETMKKVDHALMISLGLAEI
ncbi:MAG: type II toxin-antitoxin system PemK/MazF family toxin [Bacillota bacterium]